MSIFDMFLGGVKSYFDEKSDFDISGNKFTQKTPNAAAIIWNYAFRTGTKSFSSNEAISRDPLLIQKKIILYKSIISIETSKSKMNCCGSFRITLAPNKNWITELNLGSWICILMSSDGAIKRSDIDSVDYGKLKFLGVIKTVYTKVMADSSGKRKTVFIIEGEDWATALNEKVYLDYSFRLTNNPGQNENYGILLNSVALAINKNNKSFSTGNSVRLLFKLWSSTLNDTLETIRKKSGESSFKLVNEIRGNTGLLLDTPFSYCIPYEVLSYLKIKSQSNSVGKILDVKTGVVKKDGSYVDPDYYIIRTWNPSNIMGENSLWQLLHSVNAQNIEEIFNDLYIKTEDSGEMSLRPTVFNRIMPFTLRDASYTKDEEGNVIKGTAGIVGRYDKVKNAVSPEQILKDNKGNLKNAKIKIQRSKDYKRGYSEKIVSSFASYFLDVPYTKIELSDIISVSAGLSMEEKTNMIEVVYQDPTTPGTNIQVTVKPNSQEYEDERLFQRDGLKFRRFLVNYYIALDEEKLKEKFSKEMKDKISADLLDKKLSDMKDQFNKKVSSNISNFSANASAIGKNKLDLKKYTGIANNNYGAFSEGLTNKISNSLDFKSTMSSFVDGVSENPSESIKSIINPTVEDLKPFETQISNYVTSEISKIKDSSGEPGVVGWISLLALWKEWFFDIHKMLNGTIEIYGSKSYISVGSNIVFPCVALFPDGKVRPEVEKNLYILAHVSSVRNTFTVSSSGARNFSTTINFNRGIFVDSGFEYSSFIENYAMFSGHLGPQYSADSTMNVNSNKSEEISGQSTNNVIGGAIGAFMNLGDITPTEDEE